MSNLEIAKAKDQLIKLAVLVALTQEAIADFDNAYTGDDDNRIFCTEALIRIDESLRDQIYDVAKTITGFVPIQ